jgi:hypothetical protein
VTAVTWTADELDRIGAAEELELAVRRADGRPRNPVTIWVVRVGDDIYVRSWRGTDGSWYRAVRSVPEGRVRAGGVERNVRFVAAPDDVADAIDDAYRTKYARYPTYVEPMVRVEARATTLRLVPRGADGGEAR